MKRAISALLLLVMVAGLSGCVGARYGTRSGCGLNGLVSPRCITASAACPSCRGVCRGGDESINPGPPTAAITYPYYTVRGPRDFLQRNPSPIGP